MSREQRLLDSGYGIKDVVRGNLTFKAGSITSFCKEHGLESASFYSSSSGHDGMQVHSVLKLSAMSGIPIEELLFGEAGFIYADMLKRRRAKR